MLKSTIMGEEGGGDEGGGAGGGGDARADISSHDIRAKLKSEMGAVAQRSLRRASSLNPIPPFPLCNSSVHGDHEEMS